MDLPVISEMDRTTFLLFCVLVFLWDSSGHLTKLAVPA